MQPTPPEPPQPPAVAPAQGRPIGVSIADVPLPLEGLPRTVQDVQGLRVRRDMLRDQLSRASNRRDNMVQELTRASEEARAGIRQRLAQADERIMQIEREQALTERLLTNAPPAVLAASTQIREPGRESMVPEDEATAVAFSTFGAGVVLTLLVGRVRAGMRRRRLGLQPQQAAGTADDPRIERLAHAVDAIAVEVERIGEGQRFVTRLLADQNDRTPVGRETIPR